MQATHSGISHWAFCDIGSSTSFALQGNRKTRTACQLTADRDSQRLMEDIEALTIFKISVLKHIHHSFTLQFFNAM